MRKQQTMLLGVICLVAALYRFVSGAATNDQGAYLFGALFLILGVGLVVFARRQRR